jgi:Fic family protein
MQIHTLLFNPANWMAMAQELSQLDRFDAQWQAIERREQKTLKELKSIATVRSVGASTRIEESRLSNIEVERLIGNLDISKLTKRDEQEVAGYYEALNLIGESYRDIPVSESNIKQLHNVLLKYSIKDNYHKGNYKINTNRVEKTEADGSKTTIFETIPPGWPIQEAMARLVDWYNHDPTTHALIKVAIFAYEFLSIHPFQDGNGRLSRLLTTLLLMRSGYVWIEYVSFEHEIENRKKEYFARLMETQIRRPRVQNQQPGEDVTEWVYFFLDCLKNIQRQLLQKLEEKKPLESLDIRSQHIYTVVDNNPGISSGEISEKLKIPISTVKRILTDLVATHNLIVHGVGRATRYSIAVGDLIKRDVAIVLTNEDRTKEFTLPQTGAFLRIKKIVLTPKFKWEHPNEWSARLYQNGLFIIVRAVTSKGMKVSQPYSITGFNDPTYFHPVFIVHPNIVFPDIFSSNTIFKYDYPIQCSLELSGSVDKFDFDVMLVTDQS